MPLFNTPSRLDPHIEKATSDKNTSEDWSIILDVCDRVKEYSDGSKDCIKALKTKMASDNPRVALQAIILLDACVNNCGKNFLLEVASRDFESELRKLITAPRTHTKVSQKLRQCLKVWAEGEFKGNSQLSLIPSLYTKLQQEGVEFTFNSDSPKKKVEYSTDPNVVNNKQEEDDIAQAIQLSLQSSSNNQKTSNYSANDNRSLYPNALASNLETNLTISDTNVESSNAPPATAVKKARALYDFEAVEDNELTFQAGELIVVIDCSDPNWWKGSNHRGEGLFPANFVTLDINGESEDQQHSGSSRGGEKRVSFSECVKVTEVEDRENADEGPTEGDQELSADVNEDAINSLLHLLHEADPTGERPDAPQLPLVEARVNAMAPTIDAELEHIDRRHNELARLNTDLMQGLNLYHQLMREMPVTTGMGAGAGGYFPGGYAPPPHDAAHMPPQLPGYSHMYMMGQQPHHMGQQPPMGQAPIGQQPPTIGQQQPHMGAQPPPMGQQQPHIGQYPPMAMGGPGMGPPTTTTTNPPPTSYYQPPTTLTSQEGGVSEPGVLPSYGHYPDVAVVPVSYGAGGPAGGAPPYTPAYTTMSPHHQPPLQHYHQQAPPQAAFQQPLL